MMLSKLPPSGVAANYKARLVSPTGEATPWQSLGFCCLPLAMQQVEPLKALFPSGTKSEYVIVKGV